jgi:predicted regulator of Ras-like GTPase activity (Roadblock/LC7/MglB family)
MLDRILSAVHEVHGVHATLILDDGGQLVAWHAHAMYDEESLNQASRAISKAVETLKLAQDDWELVTTTFADGKVLLRNLGSTTERRGGVLAVIADSRLNAPFACVAIRVAASRIKAALAAPPAPERMPIASGPTMPVGLGGRPGADTSSGSLASGRSAPPHAEIAISSQTLPGTSSGLGPSPGVMVKDAAASGYLSACMEALLDCVGPLAKLFVREAVQRVCPDRPFAREDGPMLVAELVQHILRPADRAAFQKTLGT